MADDFRDDKENVWEEWKIDRRKLRGEKGGQAQADDGGTLDDVQEEIDDVTDEFGTAGAMDDEDEDEGMDDESVLRW
jgi:hypothetical protein